MEVRRFLPTLKLLGFHDAIIMNIVITFDGSCEPKNPGGNGAWGFSIFIGGKRQIADCGFLGDPKWMSNNYAEYCALGFALKKLLELDLPKIESLTVIGDSQLIVNQVNGEWKVKKENLAGLRNKCAEYLILINEKHGIDHTLVWVPREMNTIADELSQQGHKKWLKGKTKKT